MLSVWWIKSTMVLFVQWPTTYCFPLTLRRTGLQRGKHQARRILKNPIPLRSFLHKDRVTQNVCTITLIPLGTGRDDLLYTRNFGHLPSLNSQQVGGWIKALWLNLVTGKRTYRYGFSQARCVIKNSVNPTATWDSVGLKNEHDIIIQYTGLLNAHYWSYFVWFISVCYSMFLCENFFIDLSGSLHLHWHYYSRYEVARF